VSLGASVGEGTRVWMGAQIREGARVGQRCTLGRNTYVDAGVTVGDDCKIENNASLFTGVTLEDRVFIGPHACLTNDRNPRATRPDGTLKGAADWTVDPIHVALGASIGAGSVVLPGVTIGRFALVGAGAVVTRDVAPHSLVLGNPARHVAFVCVCGLGRFERHQEGTELHCERCLA